MFSTIAGPDPDPVPAVRAHVEATRCSSEIASAKAAGLMAMLIQTPEHLASTRVWYQSRIAGIDLSTQEGRRARLAFLAAEGAFMLRFFGLMEIAADEWEGIFQDIKTQVLQDPA